MLEHKKTLESKAKTWREKFNFRTRANLQNSQLAHQYFFVSLGNHAYLTHAARRSSNGCVWFCALKSLARVTRANEPVPVRLSASSGRLQRCFVTDGAEIPAKPDRC